MIPVKNKVTVTILYFFFSFVCYSQDSKVLKSLQLYTIADNSYLNLDTCLHYTLLAIPLLKETKQWDKYLYCLNALSYCYHGKVQYDKMLENNLFALSEAQKHLDSLPLNYYKAVQNLGVAYDVFGEYDKAEQLYKNVISDQKQKKYSSPLLVGTCYENLGILYYKLADYEMAIQYLNSSLPYLDQYYWLDMWKTSPSFMRIGQVHLHLAKVYIMKKEFKKANNHIYFAEDVLKCNPKTTTSDWESLKILKAEVFFNKNKPEETKYILRNLLKSKDLTTLSKVRCYKLMSDLHISQNNHFKAIKCLELSLIFIPTQQVVEKAHLIRQLAFCYMSVDQFEKAHELLLQSEDLLFCQKKFGCEYDYFLLQKEKIHLHLLLLRSNKSKSDWTSVSNIIIQNFSNVDRMINHFSSEQARFQFLGISKEYFELCLEYLDLYLTKNNDDDVKQKIYSLIHQTIEKSKSVILLREARINTTLSWSKEWHEYKNLMAKANYIETSLQSQNSEKKSILELELLRINESLKSINVELASNNNLLNVLNIDTLKLLSKKSNVTFLNYFLGIKKSYVLKVSDGKVIFKPIVSPIEITELGKQFFKNLKYSNKTERNQFSEFSGILYDKLMLPIGPLNTDINISPDGILHNIPFEALMKGKTNKNQNYLVSNHSISYSYSFSLMSLMSNTKNEIRKSLFIFPDLKLNGVKNDESKITAIFDDFYFKIFNTEIFEINNLINELKNYQLIHFSAHATAFDSITKGPTLYLRNNLLPLNDITNQKLIADMVILSACETMKGPEISGEGMISLNRGFVLAGVKSTLATLWKVNEGSTAKIIGTFYDNIFQGKSKNYALTLAKRNFLSNCPEYQTSPYYWAGMVLTGNNAPLIFKEKYSHLPKVGLSFFIFLTLVIIGGSIYRSKLRVHIDKN
jgi:CHAT domain-containing protein